MKRICLFMIIFLLGMILLSCGKMDKQKIANKLFSSKNILYPIIQNGKWGYIDRTGNIIINPQFDDIKETYYTYKSTKQSYDIDNTIMINNRNFITELARVKLRKKWGYIDKTGKYVINPIFDEVKEFSEDLAPAKFGEKWGYIDTSGKYIIEPQFTDADNFIDGIARVRIGEIFQTVYDDSGNLIFKDDSKYGYINKTGNYIINPQFVQAGNFIDGIANVGIGDGGKDTYYKSRNYDPKYSVFENDCVYGYIDTTRKYVINPQFDQAREFRSGIAVIGLKKSDNIDKSENDLPIPKYRYGYIDKNGKYVINPQFDEAADFSEELACVKLGDKYGYIDKTGKYIINPQFDYACNFKEGVAKVYIDKKCGYIDKNGRYDINPQYDYAMDFEGGIAPVMIDGKLGYIDKNGKYIWNPQD